MCHGKEFLWKYKVLGEAFLLKQRRDIRKRGKLCLQAPEQR